MSDLETAPAKVSVFEALNHVKSAIGAVRKNEKNTTQGFNFRGIDSVVNAAAPELNRHGVLVTPEVVEQTYETVEIGRNKTPMGHVTVAVKYTFWGPQGDNVSSTVLAEAMDSGDKACAKAMSVAYRIALLQTLNLPTDEPDPDATSYERGSTEATPGKVSTAPRDKSKIDWPAAINQAKDLDALRKVWKDAGTAGALQTEVGTGDDGKSVTVQGLLYKKSDDLTTKSSN